MTARESPHECLRALLAEHPEHAPIEETAIVLAYALAHIADSLRIISEWPGIGFGEVERVITDG